MPHKKEYIIIFQDLYVTINIEMPKVIAIKRTNFTVTWSPPSILGGCPVISYVLLRDDGNGSEVNIKIDPD